MVKELETLEEFQQAINSDNVTVIDFTASWCPPCQMVGPIFAQMAADSKNSALNFYKVDVDENEEAAAEAGIQAMPTFSFYQRGQKIDEVVGANIESVQQKVKQYLA